MEFANKILKLQIQNRREQVMKNESATTMNHKETSQDSDCGSDQNDDRSLA